MPDYHTHRNSGLERGLPVGLLSFFASAILFESLLFAAFAGIGAVFLTVLGAIFPDIDHHSSIPFRRLKVLTAAVFTFGAAWMYFEAVSYFIETSTSNVATSITGYQLGMSIVLVPLAGGLGVAVVETLRPTHRGVTHTKVAGLAVGASIGLVLLHLWDSSIQGQFLAVAACSAFYVGTYNHLSLDGLVGEQTSRTIGRRYSKVITVVRNGVSTLLIPVRRFIESLLRRFSRAPLKVKILIGVTGLALVGVLYMIARWAFADPSETATSD